MQRTDARQLRQTVRTVERAVDEIIEVYNLDDGDADVTIADAKYAELQTALEDALYDCLDQTEGALVSSDQIVTPNGDTIDLPNDPPGLATRETVESQSG